MLEVKPDIKDAEREEIVQTLKDTMVNKSGSRIMPEFVVGIYMYNYVMYCLQCFVPPMCLYMYIHNETLSRAFYIVPLIFTGIQRSSLAIITREQRGKPGDEASTFLYVTFNFHLQNKIIMINVLNIQNYSLVLPGT